MYNTEKSGATFMSHRFLCVYKYRLNGNVDRLFCKDRANPPFCICVSLVKKTIIINNTTTRKKV